MVFYHEKTPGSRWNMATSGNFFWDSRSAVLFQKLFRLVDFRCQVRRTPSIGMVQHHKGTVVLSDSLFGKLAFPEKSVSLSLLPAYSISTTPTERATKS